MLLLAYIFFSLISEFYRYEQAEWFIFLPLLPAVQGKDPGRGNTVVPEHGIPKGLGGDELKGGLPGRQFNGMPCPVIEFIVYMISKSLHISVLIYSTNLGSFISHTIPLYAF